MNTTLSVRAVGRTHIGHVRKRNEDAYYVGAHLFAIADGLGGHAAGDVASSTAIHTVSAVDRPAPAADLFDILGRAVADAGLAVRRRVREQPELAGMGTTLDALLVVGGSAVLAHIGDSRAYRWRDGRLRQLTEDHNVGHLISGADEVPNLADRITRFIDGRADGRSPDLTPVDLQAGDRYLLCTDGLSSYVPEAEIVSALAGDLADAVADRLVDLALEHGGKDNATVVLIDID